MQISIDNLREKLTGTFNTSFSEYDAAALTDYMLWAEMSGFNTQGLLKMTGPAALQNILPQHPPIIERETKLSQLINAGASPAPLISQKATDIAIEKARSHGFGIVGVHNTYSSNGVQAYYSQQIAEKDLIGIVMSRSPGSVAPFDSIDHLFGTNPISFSFPTTREPIVFDMATSAITFYGLILAKKRGEQLSDNIAIDKNGNPTNDPAEAIDGAILPFDRGYKGSGLGMMVEIMAGPLVASAFCDYKTQEEEWGSTFIAIDPELLVDTSTFKEHCSELVDVIKQSRKKQGVDEIRIPGERARSAYNDALKSGFVDVDEAILRELQYV